MAGNGKKVPSFVLRSIFIDDQKAGKTVMISCTTGVTGVQSVSLVCDETHTTKRKQVPYLAFPVQNAFLNVRTVKNAAYVENDSDNNMLHSNEVRQCHLKGIIN